MAFSVCYGLVLPVCCRTARSNAESAERPTPQNAESAKQRSGSSRWLRPRRSAERQRR